MTTSAKPRRTMLPPNLTRNYFEVKRLIAEGDGTQLPHWYQLTSEQKRAEEQQVEVFRRAVLRAEEEQDLVANFAAPAAEQGAAAADSAGPAAAAESPARPAEPCDCPRCCTVQALAEFIKHAKRLNVTLGWDPDPSVGVVVFGFTSARPAPEELASLLQELATPPPWIPASRVDRDWDDRLRPWMRRRPSGPPVFVRASHKV